MNLRQARYMCTIYEEGNISNAAKRLYVSQPALSQTIQNVEKELGTKIFNRNTSPISLTYSGERYLATAHKMLSLETSLQRELQEARNETGGRLRIGISTLRSVSLLPRILPPFIRKYPHVELEIREMGSSNMDDLLLSGKVDLVFTVSQAHLCDSFNYVTLCRERLLLFAGPNTAIARRKPPFSSIHITEVKDESFVSVRKGHGVRAIQDFIFAENKISPRILLETESVELARRLAMSCDAVTLYPETLLGNPGDPPVHYSVLGDRLSREFFICYRKDLYLPKYMSDFIAITRDTCF